MFPFYGPRAHCSGPPISFVIFRQILVNLHFILNPSLGDENPFWNEYKTQFNPIEEKTTIDITSLHAPWHVELQERPLPLYLFELLTPENEFWDEFSHIENILVIFFKNCQKWRSYHWTLCTSGIILIPYNFFEISIPNQKNFLHSIPLLVMETHFEMDTKRNLT